MTRLGLRRESDAEWVDRWQRVHRWDALGTYNAERRRGLVHTAEYDAEMAEQQAEFDREQRVRAGA